ncbi:MULTISPECIES: SRPBCC family protein [unclassified Microbacterium]|uniref:SRPBCC family protein n=1 Tax=unclassified Microbacterium TaxID=2609290 RepID=UPI001601D060|nr:MULTISPECIES: SRPBCC family protein [unclassified Microbacterium]MBT2483633.1 SRPBCC family protein [Microbacterium sp. ISL-108]
MAQFILETIVAAPPEDVFAASLDPELHLRTMARYGETMVEAPAGGAFAEGSTVTWQARHFGIRFHLRSVVFDIDPPRAFSDRQIAGPFGAFLHEHAFTEHPVGTVMRDTVTFRSPLGLIGRIVDALVMRAYLGRLIAEHNAVLAAEVEGRGRTLSG